MSKLAVYKWDQAANLVDGRHTPGHMALIRRHQTGTYEVHADPATGVYAGAIFDSQEIRQYLGLPVAECVSVRLASSATGPGPYYTAPSVPYSGAPLIETLPCTVDTCLPGGYQELAEYLQAIPDPTEDAECDCGGPKGHVPGGIFCRKE